MHTVELQGEGSGVKRTVLPSGIRVITETMPNLASETVGIWVDSGSRDETDRTAGSTHFLEHMLFKGTRTRTARQIAETFDRTGGESNAATAKEYTCYYSRCLVDDLPVVTQLLWDMVLDSLIDPAEFERERGVIIEELAMDADDPTDVLYESFDSFVFGDHPLGRPIGATKEQIAALPHEVLLEHHAANYIGPRLVFAAAGGQSHEAVVEQVLAATAHLPVPQAPGHTTEQPTAEAPADPRPLAGSRPGRPERTAPGFRSGTLLVDKETEQQGIILGVPGLPEAHPDRFTFSVMYSLLGGGMSSRLFQSVREEHGLAYSVHCFASRYQDAGQFGIYAGCSPAQAQAVVDLCAAEFARLATQTPAEDEVAAVIAQASGSTMLGLESSAARMNRLARLEMSGQPFESPMDALARVRAVTPEMVRDLAARLHAQDAALVTVGPAKSLHLPD